MDDILSDEPSGPTHFHNIGSLLLERERLLKSLARLNDDADELKLKIADYDSIEDLQEDDIDIRNNEYFYKCYSCKVSKATRNKFSAYLAGVVSIDGVEINPFYNGRCHLKGTTFDTSIPPARLYRILCSAHPSVLN